MKGAFGVAFASKTDLETRERCIKLTLVITGHYLQLSRIKASLLLFFCVLVCLLVTHSHPLHNSRKEKNSCGVLYKQNHVYLWCIHHPQTADVVDN